LSNPYQHVFSGSAIVGLRICEALEEKGIKPIVKDYAESARLAGFGATPNYQTLLVRKDQVEQATEIIKDLRI